MYIPVVESCENIFKFAEVPIPPKNPDSLSESCTTKVSKGIKTTQESIGGASSSQNDDDPDAKSPSHTPLPAQNANKRSRDQSSQPEQTVKTMNKGDEKALPKKDHKNSSSNNDCNVVQIPLKKRVLDFFLVQTTRMGNCNCELLFLKRREEATIKQNLKKQLNSFVDVMMYFS